VITQKRLKSLFSYDESTGLFTRIVTVSNQIAGTIVGNKRPDGYLQVTVDRKHYLIHRLAWLYVHGYFPENDIDHKDLIRDHNWIENLRESSRACNIINTGNRCTNTSGVKGVLW